MNARQLRLTTVAALVAVLAVACGDDAAPRADSSSAITTAPVSTEPASDTTAPADPTTTTGAAVTTAESTTTVAPTTTQAPAAWEVVGPMPDLAYIPCCASNYVGDPSPPIPADPAVPLAPGIYHASRERPAPGEELDPTRIDVGVAPFVPCGTPDVFCESGFVDGEVGVGEVARRLAMPLDDSVRVVVSGFACVEGGSNIGADVQAGTGTLLAELQAEFEAAYTQTVAPLVAAGASFEEVQAQFATPANGFSVPCVSAGPLQWQGSAGPNLLMQFLGEFDEATASVVVPASISVEILWLTALEVAPDGSPTLYFYAGFLS